MQASSDVPLWYIRLKPGLKVWRQGAFKGGEFMLVFRVQLSSFLCISTWTEARSCLESGWFMSFTRLYAEKYYNWSGWNTCSWECKKGKSEEEEQHPKSMTKIKWNKEMKKKRYPHHTERNMLWCDPCLAPRTHKSICLQRYTLCMCVRTCVCVCVRGCLCVSASVNDLWFVFTMPYFGLACRHRRMNDKLRMSIGFTRAPVVPRSPGHVAGEQK